MCFKSIRICHWGPLSALGIIKLVTGVTLYSSSMWWPATTWAGFLHTCCFMSLSGLTLYNFMSSVYQGPGSLPLKWKPANEEDAKYLQWCGVCQGYKAPRAHHCRKCERCVLKMDHHCPWINNCVGWGNHAHFVFFLLFAVLGCSHASVVLSFSLYRGINRTWYLYHGIKNVPIVYLNLYSMILCVFALGLAIGVVLAVGMLLFFQVRAIVRNRTGIEDWIVEKAFYRRKNTQETFVFPYDLGARSNFKQVMNFTGEPIGDGITWPLAENCDQFTLTREQLEQKAEKRQRTKLYSICNDFSGAWFPLTKGFFTLLNPPCTDEPRIKLRNGDKVLVTRWRKYWLFGKKLEQDLPEDQQSTYGVRGWFPRKCAVECQSPFCSDQDKKIK